MCGIVGAVSGRTVVPILLEGLRRLEYRGYDSAGLAVLGESGELQRVRRKGKLKELETALNQEPMAGAVGIAHTRWATHGPPTECNAHPHVCRNRLAVVHNGIVENHHELRRKLREEGYEFCSDTDSEVIAHQIHGFLAKGLDLLEAVKSTCAVLEGAYAIGVVCADEPGRLIAARRGSPLVVGLGKGEHFLASDMFALVGKTRRFLLLEEGDVAELSVAGVRVYGRSGAPVKRRVHETTVGLYEADKGAFRHFMQKEIHEQPAAIERTLEGRFHKGRLLSGVFGPAAETVFDGVKAIQIVACGTSYHASLVARYWLEGLAGVPCAVEMASEFRYRQPVVAPDSLFVSVSQSGETADTLAALKVAKQRGYVHTLALCNVPESSIVRASDSSLLTRAGPEIGVASTKAFTTQLAAFLFLVIALGRRNGLTASGEAEIVRQLEELPERLREVLALESEVERWALELADRRHALYLGRGCHYPIAMEGALKLKEISYIHAEAYPSGELKHGPLALVDEQMPVIAVAPNDDLLDKLRSNLEEVQARGGQLFVFADRDSMLAGRPGLRSLSIAPVDSVVAPIVHVLPLQMLAYHVARAKGTDIDQPRNLAKSVTVE
jgi:glucosamine--fructose-6-phosphate aminotransferase (isomerizing)